MIWKKYKKEDVLIFLKKIKERLSCHCKWFFGSKKEICEKLNEYQKVLIKNYIYPKQKEPKTIYRSLYIILAAFITFFLLYKFGLITIKSGKVSFEKSSEFVKISTLFVTAPVLFVVWLFRDSTRLRELKTKQKDTNLKDFHKLQEDATGKTDPKNQTLQTAALFSLEPFLRGQYGEDFQVGARATYKALAKDLHKKLIDNVLEELSFMQKGKDKDFKSIFNQAISKTPLTKELNLILSRNYFYLFLEAEEDDYNISLVGVMLAGKPFVLPKSKNICKHVKFWRADFRFSLLQKSIWIGIDLFEADFSYATLKNATLKNVSMENAKLENTDLENTDLENTDLENANLKNANLKNANLKNANLKNANLKNANLENANLENANLKNANLKNANLKNANLKNAIFENNDLENANLKNANLKNANLKNAIFENNDLENANLKNANLENAIFENNDLENDNLEVSPYKTNLFSKEYFKSFIKNTDLENISLKNDNLKVSSDILGYSTSPDSIKKEDKKTGKTGKKTGKIKENFDENSSIDEESKLTVNYQEVSNYFSN